jgi:hypothetical protein
LPDASGTVILDSSSATTTASGVVELATVAEAQAGTDSVRAVTPDGLPMRRVGTAWIGGDLTGNARGTNALDIQSYRLTNDQVASREEGINFGTRLKNNGVASTAVGYQNTIAQTSLNSSADPSFGCSVFGLNSQAAGQFSTAVGVGSFASGNECTAIGSGVGASGDVLGNGSATAVGSASYATGSFNTAIGAFCEANSPAGGSTAIGTGAIASGATATAIGYSAYATGDEAVAIGSNVTSANYQSVAIGVYSSARGINGTAIGYASDAIGAYSLALGVSSVVYADGSVAIGSGSYVSNDNTARLNALGTGSAAYIRLHGNTGMCALTVQNRATEYDDAKRSQTVTITRSGTTATVTLAGHGYSIGAAVTIAGAGQAAYNGLKTILSSATNTFTYEVFGSPATPATGTITAVAGDAVERDNTLARGEFAIRRNGLQFILDYNDGGVIKNIVLGTAT